MKMNKDIPNGMLLILLLYLWAVFGTCVELYLLVQGFIPSIWGFSILDKFLFIMRFVVWLLIIYSITKRSYWGWFLISIYECINIYVSFPSLLTLFNDALVNWFGVISFVYSPIILLYVLKNRSYFDR